MQRLGQHFLKNKGVVRKIIDTLDPGPNETLIEIGPGHGELTFSVAEICKDLGCKIIAIEKDSYLAASLKEKLSADGIKNIEVREADALKELGNAAEMSGSYKIFGDIPYYITGHLLRKIGDLEPRPERAVIMVQKEVAERICAEPPKMNRLAASIQYWADPKIICTVKSGDFSPPPEVDSAVIFLKTRDGLKKNFSVRYYKSLHALFAQPRKTVMNNLAAGLKDAIKKNDLRATIESALLKIGVNPTARPQNLNVGDILNIGNEFFV